MAQTAEGWFLSPRLLGKRIGLHPVWVLVALLLGVPLRPARNGGGVPVAAAIRVILRHALQAYRESSLYGSSAPDIVLYVRKDSSLCEDFERLLKPLLEQEGMDYQRAHVESLPALLKEFGARVPVLEINGKIIAEGHTSSRELKQKLEGDFGEI